MLNIKFGSAVVAMSLVGAAQAHWRFTMAYGDANLASINGSSVGTEMAAGSTLKVPTSGNNFTVQVWAEKLSSPIADNSYAGGSVHIAYDLAPFAPYSNQPTWPRVLSSESTFMHKKVTASTASAGGSLSNYATGLTYYRYSGTLLGNDGYLMPLDRVFRSVFTGDTSSPRKSGLSTQFGVNAAGVILPNIGERIHLFDFRLTSQLAAGQTYGFGADEVGLELYCYGGSNRPPGGSSCWMGANATHDEIGMRVNLQAVVPEPGSLLALAGGCAVLLRRKRI